MIASCRTIWQIPRKIRFSPSSLSFLSPSSPSFPSFPSPPSPSLVHRFFARSFSSQLVREEQEARKDFYRRILSTIEGRSSEVRQYLKHFAKIDSQKFAILLIEESLSSDSLKNLATSLTFLHKCGLFPIVIHGATAWNNIYNVPFKPFQIEANHSFQLFRENSQIIEAIEEVGGRAKPILNQVFVMNENKHGQKKSEHADAQKNFEITRELVESVSIDGINSIIKLGHLPVISPVIETKGGKMYHFNPLLATIELALKIKPHKVIFVNSEGGFKKDNKTLSTINLKDEFPMLFQALEANQATKLSFIFSLLQHLPNTSSAAITSSGGLIDELFTHIGSKEGTLLRLGMEMKVFEDLKEISVPRLAKLLEDAFGKKLDEGYFPRLMTVPFKIYLAGDFKGCAILTYEGGIPYMCKFAVSPSSQGQGIADILWANITLENKDMFWRSREDNGVNNWYFSRADGSYRAGKWTVFWYGLKGFDLMQFYKDYSMNLPATFHQKIESTFT